MKYWTPQEWVNWYKKKTGDTFEVPENHTINYHARRGIMTLYADFKAKMLMIGYVVGDGRYWHDTAEMIAKHNGLRYLATICTRDVEAYIRFWQYKIVKQWDSDGQKRYLTVDPLGHYAVLTYRGKDNRTGVDTYTVIEYLAKGEKPKLE